MKIINNKVDAIQELKRISTRTNSDKKNKINDINLIRPLLDEKREDLEFLSNFVFNFYVQDPSNKNEKFLRIKIRQLIENLKINGLDKYKFVKTLKNLKSSNEVVNFYVRENFNRNTHYLKKENKLILNENFFLQPYEIVFRCLSNAIKMIGGKYYSVRGKKTDNLISKLQNNRSFKVTLGSCIIEKVNQTVIIYQEY
jgi:tRNA(Ile)-lysidine synthase